MITKFQLWSASGGIYGNGHILRMRQLESALCSTEYKVEFHDLTGILGNNCLKTSNTIFQNHLVSLSVKSNTDCVLDIVDLRDIDPKLWNFSKNVLFLDNQNILRHSTGKKTKKYRFYDTIPHPNLELSQSMQALWFPDALIELTNKTLTKKNRAIFYSGDLERDRVEKYFDYFLEFTKFAGIDDIIQIGKHKISNIVNQIESINQKLFYEMLARSRYYFSYYGLGIFEALLLNIRPVLYQISSRDHQVLSGFIAKSIHIPYIKEADLFDISVAPKFKSMQEYKPVQKPGRHGFLLLIQEIQKITGEKFTIDFP